MHQSITHLSSIFPSVLRHAVVLWFVFCLRCVLYYSYKLRKGKEIMRNFYAIHDDYMNLVAEDGLPVGSVYIFSSKKDRDAWVEDGDVHCYAVRSRVALGMMKRGVGYWLKDEVPYRSIQSDDIVRAYVYEHTYEDGLPCALDMRH